MSSTSFYDDLIRDYLLFRGFTATLKAFEAELKSDKDKGFRVDRIVDQLSSLIASYDLTGLREVWNHLEQRVLARLEHQFLSTVRRLENGLLKMYAVNAVQTNRHDKLVEFFEKMSAELQNQPEWKEWFVLPFVKSPEDNPAFAVYFTKQWQDTLLVSLHNFISVVFQMFKNTPTLLSYEVEQARMAKLVQENDSLKQKIVDLTGREAYDTALDTDHATSASADLMDDFYIIAQEAPPTENKTIRSIIRNISSGLPTSPILGRKTSAPSSSNAAAAAATVRREVAEDTQTAPKFAIMRSKTRPTSQPVRRGRPASESESSNKHDNGSIHDKEATGSKFLDTLKDTDRTTSEASRRSSVGCSSGCDVANKTDDSKSPFILLSQEEYKEHNAAVTHCTFNTSNSMVASSDMNGIIKIWSPSPSLQTLATVISKSAVLALEWDSKTDKLLLIGNNKGTVRLYDTKEKRTLCEVGLESAGNAFTEQSRARVTCLACSPTEASFVACIREESQVRNVRGSLNPLTAIGRLTLWDMKSMKLEKSLSLQPYSSVINCCVFNHNGQLLLIGAADGRISLYDMRGCDCIAMWHGHQGNVYTVQFSPDETSCYSLGEDGLFSQWSINKTGQKMSCTKLHEKAAGPFVLPHSGNIYRPTDQLFASNSDGKHFLTCAPKGGIIYSMSGEAAQSVMSLGGHKWPVVTVDWSTAGDCGTCITASLDGDIRVSTILAHR